MLFPLFIRTLRQSAFGAARVAACVALSCGAGFAADEVSMAVHETRGDYLLNGSFHVAADPSVVWDVLTAYDQIPDFVGSLKKSHVEQDLGVYHFLLKQEFEGGFLFFTKRVAVLLDVHEVWYQSIQFNDVDHKDFAVYEGAWNVKPEVNGEEITYELEAKPNFSAPLMGDFMNGGAKDLLSAVRREILRRQALVDKEKAGSPRPSQPNHDDPPALAGLH